MPKVKVRDLDMYYEIHGRSDGEPLVLMHGFTATGYAAFGKFLDQLGESYRLFLPDMRGHGRTTNPGGGIMHSELAYDTAVFVNAVGLDRAHFCGHSSGGMHLLFLALEHPQLIHSLALVSVTYTFDEHVKTMARKVRSSAGSEWTDRLKTLHGETHGVEYADTILDLWLNAVLRPDELPFTPEGLREINCPTLVMHGDRDTYFPVHVPVTIYEAIPNAELCILPNCGHMLPIESPKLFLSTLLEFLSRNPFDANNR